MEVGRGLVEVTLQLNFPGSEQLSYILSVLLVEAGQTTVISVLTGETESYTTGDKWSITVPNLMFGRTYRFRISVSNEFGLAVGPLPSANFTLKGDWVWSWVELVGYLAHYMSFSQLVRPRLKISPCI